MCVGGGATVCTMYLAGDQLSNMDQCFVQPGIGIGNSHGTQAMQHHAAATSNILLCSQVLVVSGARISVRSGAHTTSKS